MKVLGTKTKHGAAEEEEEEIDNDNEGIELNLLHPEKTKRRAEGYPDIVGVGVGALVYRTLNASESEFVHSDRYEQLLAGWCGQYSYRRRTDSAVQRYYGGVARVPQRYACA